MAQKPVEQDDTHRMIAEMAALIAECRMLEKRTQALLRQSRDLERRNAALLERARRPWDGGG